ncbi:MAG: biotin--[acetyl-CoA-carboxylase] ligase [Phycisphaerae bacterium]
MTHAEQILAILYDAPAGVGADQLAARCNCTKAQVQRALGQLRQRGHRIVPASAGAWKLQRPVKLDACLVERGLPAGRLGRSVICFDEVDSTSDVAAESLRQGGTDGLVITAEFQRLGRGRQGKPWLSPPGANLLMSIVLTDEHAPLPGHEGLTIAAGLATAEGAERTAGVHVELKWPNDVEIDGHKTAGVLVELVTAGSRRAAIVGIGVNVSAAPPAGQVDRPATCLETAAGETVERVELARAILSSFDAWLVRLAAGDVGALHDAWVCRCGMIHQPVVVRAEGRLLRGTVMDVQPLEGLVLRCDDGSIRHVPAHHASVLK